MFSQVLHASPTSKEHGDTQVACVLHCLRKRLRFSATERHTVPQQPQAQTLNTPGCTPLKAAEMKQTPRFPAQSGLVPHVGNDALSSSLPRSHRLLSAAHAWHRLAAKQQSQVSLQTRRHGRRSSWILAVAPAGDDREWVSPKPLTAACGRPSQQE